MDERSPYPFSTRKTGQSVSHDDATAFVSYTREFAGAEGLAQLRSASTSISTADPDRFRMRVEARPLARTRILDVRLTPHRGVWDHRTEGRIGESVVLFQFVLSGRAIGNVDGHTMVRPTGSIHVMRAGSPMHYVSDGPIRTVTLWVVPELLSPTAMDSIRRVTWLELRDDTNARGAASILQSVLHIRPEAGSTAAADLERVLIAQLESAVIAAAASPSEQIVGLFTRIRQMVVASPGVDRNADALADALGVTPAAVRRALLAHRTTTAQLVRDVRFDRLSALLRADGSDESLADLAEQAGYGGADQAGRAFRDRTGVSMSAYRRLVRL